MGGGWCVGGNHEIHKTKRPRDSLLMIRSIVAKILAHICIHDIDIAAKSERHANTGLSTVLLQTVMLSAVAICHCTVQLYPVL